MQPILRSFNRAWSLQPVFYHFYELSFFCLCVHLVLYYYVLNVEHVESPLCLTMCWTNKLTFEPLTENEMLFWKLFQIKWWDSNTKLKSHSRSCYNKIHFVIAAKKQELKLEHVELSYLKGRWGGGEVGRV